MSDYAWQPVARMNPNINIDDRMATYLAIHGAKFTITVEGLEAVAVLRGDLALCRRVSAPASVTDEVREALRVYLEYYPYRHTDFGGYVPKPGRAYRTLIEFLNAQPTPTQEADDAT